MMTWKNTRLIPPDINSKKASFWDTENKDLCRFLLGRDYNGEERKDPYEQQRAVENGDRFAKLMMRGKGQSQRMRINGAEANKKKKAYRSKKRK